MAHYIVRAIPKPGRVDELCERSDRKAFEDMRPFGRVLTALLENARYDPETGAAV